MSQLKIKQKSSAKKVNVPATVLRAVRTEAFPLLAQMAMFPAHAKAAKSPPHCVVHSTPLKHCRCFTYIPEKWRGGAPNLPRRRQKVRPQGLDSQVATSLGITRSVQEVPIATWLVDKQEKIARIAVLGGDVTLPKCPRPADVWGACRQVERVVMLRERAVVEDKPAHPQHPLTAARVLYDLGAIVPAHRPPERWWRHVGHKLEQPARVQARTAEVDCLT
jgi:hypothetical protein